MTESQFVTSAEGRGYVIGRVTVSVCLRTVLNRFSRSL